MIVNMSYALERVHTNEIKILDEGKQVRELIILTLFI